MRLAPSVCFDIAEKHDSRKAHNPRVGPAIGELDETRILE